MAKYKVKSGGGWPAVYYAVKMAKKAGGIRKLYRILNSQNTCKTCALGMGGMSNEAGESFQVCKKSMQAQVQDMQPAIAKQVFETVSMRDFKHYTGRKLEALGRLADPLYLAPGASHFQVLSRDEAQGLLLQRWRAAQPERSFFYASGRSSMEAGFLLQLLARQWGTNNINNCSYYCHQASSVGLSKSIGGNSSTVDLQDIQKADLVVLIGANPASNHPRLMNALAKLRRRGGQVVVINPFKELGLQRFSLPSDPRSLLLGSEIASLYLQPHIGGDLALLKAAAVYLWHNKQVDWEFINQCCNHLTEFSADLEAADLDDLLLKSGVENTDFQVFCEMLAQSQRTIYAWSMGITQHTHGVDNVQAIANLALLRGMVGKSGAGLLPIRGHSNIQGMGSVGVVPQLKPEMAIALLEQHGVSLPEAPGKDTLACLQAAFQGEMDFSLMLGGNLYAASPDLTWAAKALGNIDFTVSLSTTLNLGHIRGHGKEALILPVRARDEEVQSTSQESMFNYVRLSLGGQMPPSDNMLSEVDILVQVAIALMGESPVPWSDLQQHASIRQMIADTVPNMQPITALAQTQGFTIATRVKHSSTFNTSDGKANFAILHASDAQPVTAKFNLMTFRSEGQFNTIIYEEEDLYRGVQHRYVVFMHTDDIHQCRFTEGQWVWVTSEISKIHVEVVAAPIRQGNVAMYYPEANVLVPNRADEQSKTPAFKHVSVSVTQAEQATDKIHLAVAPIGASL